MEKSQIDSHLKIVFFDGVCHLCNGFVDFAIQNETAPKSLIFAPLQGHTAQKFLSSEQQKSLSTVLFYQDGKILQKSEAILDIAKHLKFPWPVLSAMARVIPAQIRDRIYDWVAKNRYAWFGTRDSCRLPTPEEKNQLWP